MIRISKIIPKTLTWRLILTSVSVLMAVQFIIIVVFVLDMRQTYAENAHRMTLLRVLSTVRVLDHNDPKIYHEFIKTRLTRGLFANITSNPIIPNNRNSDYESKIREELQDDSREIFIETDTKFDVNTENLDFKEKESLKGFNYVANKKPDNLFYAPVSPEREPFPQEKPPFRRSQHLPPYHGGRCCDLRNGGHSIYLLITETRIITMAPATRDLCLRHHLMKDTIMTSL